MAKNFAQIAFGEATKQLQEIHGSRASYARMENMLEVHWLDTNTQAFIQSRDSFYMSSIGENGYPYIQHRWGPKGFLKVLDANTIGFIDFSGNRQYISTGNILTHPEVALILVDYPAQMRLKILARAEIIELSANPTLLQQLDLTGYDFRPERMMVFHIEAYDWNCPQHITPRYTDEEIENLLTKERAYKIQLESENRELRKALKTHNGR